jgi:import receptor subunit TOM20
MQPISTTSAGIMLTFVNSYASFFSSRLLTSRSDPTPGKDKKRAEKSATHSKDSLLSSSTTEVTAVALRDALEQVKNEEVPESPQEKESYFMSHVSMGEQLSAQGTRRQRPSSRVVC